MATFQYFAYGSNMLVERLQARCPSARPIGMGRLVEHELQFTKDSKDGSTKATIAKNENKYVLGVLYEISDTELNALDKAEGSGYGYNRIDAIDATLVAGQSTISAKTYIEQASHHNAKGEPYNWYHALVVAGAKQNRLEANYIDQLCDQPFIDDTDLDRDARLEALRVLELAGFNETGKLLR